MGVYLAPIVFALWSLVVGVCRNRKLDLLSIFAFSFFVILVSGFRWNSDVDYQPYSGMYDETPLLAFFNYENIRNLHGEPGYLFVSSLFKTLGFEFYFLAFCLALFSISVKAFVFFLMSRQASVALCLYLCIHFITIEIIQVRWAAATALICLGAFYQCNERAYLGFFFMMLAVGVHYFSAVFLLSFWLVESEGFKRFVFLFCFSLLLSFLMKSRFLEIFIIRDSEIYVIKRLMRYLEEPGSNVGFFSYAKMVMYPLIGAGCAMINSEYKLKKDRLNFYIFRMSMVTLSFSLLVVSVPLLNFRLMVVADFFSIIFVINMVEKIRENSIRIAILSSVSAMYVVWYFFDFMNYVDANRLYEYRTWYHQIL